MKHKLNSLSMHVLFYKLNSTHMQYMSALKSEWRCLVMTMLINDFLRTKDTFLCYFVVNFGIDINLLIFFPSIIWITKYLILLSFLEYHITIGNIFLNNSDQLIFDKMLCLRACVESKHSMHCYTYHMRSRHLYHTWFSFENILYFFETVNKYVKLSFIW